MLHRGLHVWSLKNYCVTVMDNWTRMRLFWTRGAAIKWRDSIGLHAHAFHWNSNEGLWIEMSRDLCEPPAYMTADSATKWNASQGK